MLVERAGKEGWAVAAEAGVTVALDTHVDEQLDRERRVYELIRRVNALRKDSGLALSDRITLTIPAADADLLEHAEWIKAETLAVVARGGRRRRAGHRADVTDDVSPSHATAHAPLAEEVSASVVVFPHVTARARSLVASSRSRPAVRDRARDHRR